jgi:hypothetical protein
VARTQKLERIATLGQLKSPYLCSMVAMAAKVGLKEAGSFLSGTTHKTLLLRFLKSTLTGFLFMR